MTVKQLTAWPTEADLEAAIQAALQRAFPWLPQGSIRHQTKFAFHFGHSSIEVDGATASRSEARADILLYLGDQPLAVLELKRAGARLTRADEEQGLSYARMLHPRPPLVVVTNGADARLLETHTGYEWRPTEVSEAAFKQLIEAAGRASTLDLKQAVSTLMASSPQIWVQAVRQASAATIEELSGSWSEATLPFVHGFLIPRRATRAVLDRLIKGSRLITVEGPPLVGKSSILCELSKRTAEAPDIVVLFLEAESGGGVFQALADVLRSALSWPVTREEAREWLLRLSQADGPALVLAIDGLSAERDAVRDDIVDITSPAFGAGVRVVAALDDVTADKVMLNSTGRKASAIGRRADRVHLDLLDNAEFERATKELWPSRLVVMPGGQSAEELRAPWVLRAVASRYEESLQQGHKGLAAAVPPLLGLELIAHARDHFTDHELRRLFRSLAQAVIKDGQDRKRSVALILQSLATFVVRRQTLRRFLDITEIDSLVERGLLRPFQPRSGEPLLIVRHSELLASEIADILGKELATRAEENPEEAADWIAGAAGNLPLGDVVAAQAICDAAIRHGGLPINVIVSLLNTPPQRHNVKPGTRSTGFFPGLGAFDMTFREAGALSIEFGGLKHIIEPDPGEEEHVSYSDFYPWLILSHLAGQPFIAGSDCEDRSARVDPALLLEVGACAIVLRRPGGNPDVVGVPTHDNPGAGSMVCHEAGIVEAITWSMFKFLSAEATNAEPWIEQAVKRKSLPLMARVDLALRHLATTADTKAAPWARAMLETVVRPALRDLTVLHGAEDPTNVLRKSFGREGHGWHPPIAAKSDRCFARSQERGSVAASLSGGPEWVTGRHGR